MSKIRFIYFDLGGVIIRDFGGTNKWNELKTDIGLKPSQFHDFEDFFNKYEPQVCLGLDIETLVPKLKEKFNLNLPSNYSLLMDFVNRFEVNPYINDVLLKARKNYKIGLLTNMYPNMLAAIYKRNLIPDIKFDIVVDSSIVYLKKPDVEIFEYATQKAGVEKDEILFIDNGKENANAAKIFGWQGFLYDHFNMQKSSEELLKLI